MRGFEVEINGCRIGAGVKRGQGHIMITLHRGHIFCDVSGYDVERYYHISWFSEEMDIGDKICFKYVDDVDLTPIVKEFPSDRDSLLKQYHKLKEELIKEGLL